MSRAWFDDPSGIRPQAVDVQRSQHRPLVIWSSPRPTQRTPRQPKYSSPAGSGPRAMRGGWAPPTAATPSRPYPTSWTSASSCGRTSSAARSPPERRLPVPTARLRLRDSSHPDSAFADVDLDTLTPKARALAKAVHSSSGHQLLRVLCDTGRLKGDGPHFRENYGTGPDADAPAAEPDTRFVTNWGRSGPSRRRARRSGRSTTRAGPCPDLRTRHPAPGATPSRCSSATVSTSVKPGCSAADCSSGPCVSNHSMPCAIGRSPWASSLSMTSRSVMTASCWTGGVPPQ